LFNQIFSTQSIAALPEKRKRRMRVCSSSAKTTKHGFGAVEMMHILAPLSFGAVVDQSLDLAPIT